MTRLTILFILGCFSGIGAQTVDREVVAAQGNTSQLSGLTLFFTVGEPLVGSLQKGKLVLTQGFQQGTLEMQPTAVTEIEDRLKIKVYPNPTISRLYLEREEAVNSAPLKISVFSAEGRQVGQVREWPAGMPGTMVDLQNMPAGQYFLHLWEPATETPAVIPFQKTGY